MGGEVTLKLPFILGHVEDDTKTAEPSKAPATAHVSAKLPPNRLKNPPDENDVNADNPIVDVANCDDTAEILSRVAAELLSTKCNDDAHFVDIVQSKATTAATTSSTLDDIVVDSIPVVSAVSALTNIIAAPMQPEDVHPFRCRTNSSYADKTHDSDCSAASKAATTTTTSAAATVCNIVTAQVHSSAN